ncbi:hypothetical protein KP509_11G060500 [Ceratopteris richardii]|uniref:Nodulin-like domain-containing protein n=1 Tax=Ceratopteris richardii TaxID=49495 RepID=A0A8T2TT23_CERRI|nr:hypothetical protein KP509_11G060500 [Ceratopteris richardii]
MWNGDSFCVQVCILMFIGTNGETYFNTGSMVTNVRNFPKSRGHVVGLLKGFTGLCSAIFTQIYTTFFAPDVAAYLFIVAVGPTMVALFVMFIIRPIKEKPGDSMRSERIGFTFIYADCLVVAAYLMGVMILQDFISVTYALSLTFTLILLFLILLPLVTPVVSWLVRKKTSLALSRNVSEVKTSIPTSQHAEEKSAAVPLLPEGALTTQLSFTSEDLGRPQFGYGSRPASFAGSVDFSEIEDEKPSDIELLPEAIRKQKILEIRNRIVFAAAEGAVRVKRKRGPRRGEDFTLLQGLIKADFWLLFFALVCGAGTGLTAIDNMGQLSESQGYANSNVFVSMLSIWNFLGRLLGGYASELLARGYALPRSWALAVSLLLMTIGNVLFAMAWPGTLYVGTLLVGIGYGSHWGIIPPILSEIFGLKNFGMFYNFYIMASPIGSIFFSGFLAGYLYDIEAAKQQAGTLNLNSTDLTCLGASCFRLTFLIMTGVCIVGIVLTVVVSIRTSSVYKALYGKQNTSR